MSEAAPVFPCIVRFLPIVISPLLPLSVVAFISPSITMTLTPLVFAASSLSFFHAPS
ncbi:MAG: hypothetical protein ACTTKX_05235 [Treponema sp.]